MASVMRDVDGAGRWLGFCDCAVGVLHCESSRKQGRRSSRFIDLIKGSRPYEECYRAESLLGDESDPIELRFFNAYSDSDSGCGRGRGLFGRSHLAVNGPLIQV